MELIIDTLSKLGMQFDEGAVSGGDKGDYGPYRQSERAEIYGTYAKQLVREGKAYPCFCSEQELEDIRARQEEAKLTPGYYGEFAVWRDAPLEKVEAEIANGKAFVLRYRSEGDSSHKFKFNDMIKGTIDITENDIDHVILKSDGIPTYHFAHAVDDHLMGTTHVVRDESWLSTLPFHIQLFAALGFKLPKYCHTAQVLKLDNGNKRKISKRKDPEAALTFYYSEGYPTPALREYLLTLLNSNFEEWRIANPDLPIEKFSFTTKKMPISGSLFDLDKLNDISKNVISKMSAEEVFELSNAWAKEYNEKLAALYAKDEQYATNILNIDRENKKPRKDIAKWSDIPDYISYMYDETFTPCYELCGNATNELAKNVLEKYIDEVNLNDDKDTWFSRIKSICEPCGCTPNVKEYKQNPENFKGHVGDVSTIIRVALTGRTNTPDLFSITAL